MTRPLVIRADAGSDVGVGHVMRCLVLAERWRTAGGAVVFAQTSSTPAIERRLRSGGFETVMLAVTPGTLEDARATLELARNRGAEWVVADHYQIDAAWQKELKSGGARLLVFDDYGQAEHFHADIVLNQNASAEAAMYARREAGTRLLLGTRFAALRSEFLASRGHAREIPAEARKVLVTFGGADPANMTLRAIEGLATIPEVAARVVVGGSNPHRESLLAAATASRANIELIEDATNMAELMAWADVAVAAGGSTSWELACMGLPALAVVLAENQRAIALELDRREVSICLGDHRAVTSAVIATQLRALLSDRPRREAMSQRGRELVDGHGANRVIAAMGGPLALTLVSDRESWINAFLPELKAGLEAAGHRVQHVHEPADIPAGDISFLLSVGQLVPATVLQRNAHNLVVHASSLPHGRGWSPLTWQVLEGKTEIPVSLFEAASKVDRGDIYAQETLRLAGNELLPEMQAALGAATVRLCRGFAARYPWILDEARPQAGEPTYYRRRRPADSRLDPDKKLSELFNLLRVCDPDRYPAFFELAGRRYEVRLSVA